MTVIFFKVIYQFKPGPSALIQVGNWIVLFFFSSIKQKKSYQCTGNFIFFELPGTAVWSSSFSLWIYHRLKKASLYLSISPVTCGTTLCYRLVIAIIVCFVFLQTSSWGFAFLAEKYTNKSFKRNFQWAKTKYTHPSYKISQPYDCSLLPFFLYFAVVGH